MDYLKELTLYKSPYPKKRVGNAGDGGYIICDLPDNYDVLISGGICDNITFENHFLELFPQIECFAFDGTVDGLPRKNPKITFVRKNLGAENTESLSNLQEYLEPFHNIFMKIDIEGHEYNLFPAFSEKHMSKIKQLIIEIHTPADIKVKPLYYRDVGHITNSDMYNMIKSISKTHTLVHLHGNNGSRLCHMIEGVIVPNVFECTFIRNDFISNKVLNDEPLPTSLDSPNLVGAPDFSLKGFPYSL